MAVTDDRAKNAADTYFFAEVIEDEADYPAETLLCTVGGRTHRLRCCS